MTCTQPHCESCFYRHAAGTLTIRTSALARTEDVCCACASEALGYYNDLARRPATFQPWPTP